MFKFQSVHNRSLGFSLFTNTYPLFQSCFRLAFASFDKQVADPLYKRYVIFLITAQSVGKFQVLFHPLAFRCFSPFPRILVHYRSPELFSLEVVLCPKNIFTFLLFSTFDKSYMYNLCFSTILTTIHRIFFSSIPLATKMFQFARCIFVNVFSFGYSLFNATSSKLFRFFITTKFSVYLGIHFQLSKTYYWVKK